MRIVPLDRASLGCDGNSVPFCSVRFSILICCVLTFSLLLTGCQTADYYAQAIHGQFQLWHRQRPIPTLLEDPATPPPLKQRLRLVLEIRDFAERDLNLHANGHYLRYADLGRPFAVWNVYAAPEFSIDPKSWWYPVVGRLEYRGYFSEQKARRYAAALEKEGFDVYVGGVTAYSTLGWFRDPVLNTFIHDDDMDLAELLFHELAHQRLFVAGDTDFNEAFATAVADEGSRRWMEARRDPAAAEKHHAAIRRRDQFVQLVAQAREKLKSAYECAGNPSPATRHQVHADTRRAKQIVIEELRRGYSRLKVEWGGRKDYDHWFAQSLNNAQLNTVDTYHHLVPAFRRLLHENAGDLESFYKAAAALGRLKKEDRQARLTRLFDDAR